MSGGGGAQEEEVTRGGREVCTQRGWSVFGAHKEDGLGPQWLAAGRTHPLPAPRTFHLYQEREPSAPNRTQVKERGLTTGGDRLRGAGFGPWA